MIIKIVLLCNQYHGNAWHHAHCEGLIDWPPAPWRILRAIIAGAYNVNLSHSQQAILKQILWKMAQVSPTYYLPPTAYLQWRSRRPQVQKDASSDTGKTLYSACLLVPEYDSAIYCQYDIESSDSELKTLQQTFNGITYLGRKESPAVWELVGEMPFSANAYPDPDGLRVVASPLSSNSEDELWNCLNLSAAEVFQHRKQAVFPGVEQTTYKLESTQFHSYGDRLQIFPKQVLLSVQGTNKVSVSQSIALCEALHRRLAKFYPEPIFTGMDMGVKIRDHKHAFITPITERTGRWIEYIKLYAHEGFSSSAINAIANIEQVRINQWVSLAIVDFSHSSEQHSCWESITPMFLSRYPVMRDGRPRMINGTSYQKDCPEHQALKYLKFLPHLGLNGKDSFEEFPNGLGMRIDGELIAVCKCELWVDAGRMLNGKHGKLSLEKGFKVWLEFTHPFCSPISLGYRCHYGFGSLKPVRGWVGVEKLIPQSANVSLSVS